MTAEKGLAAPVGTGPRKGLFRYELLGCARTGHVLVGKDVARVRPEDAMIVRERDGLRWHRCLRCDGWLPLPPPDEPEREFCPAPEEVEIPLRGRLLRDRYVLRLIALDRVVHFVVLAALAIGIFVFAREREALSGSFFALSTRSRAASAGEPAGPAKEYWASCPRRSPRAVRRFP